MNENKLLKALVFKRSLQPGGGEKKPGPTQQAYDLLGLQPYKQCLNNMEQETTLISSSKQALFFSRWAAASGREAAWQRGTGL